MRCCRKNMNSWFSVVRKAYAAARMPLGTMGYVEFFLESTEVGGKKLPDSLVSYVSDDAQSLWEVLQNALAEGLPLYAET